MTELTSNNVMIDPSLVVARKTINNTFNLIREFYYKNREFKFYFPKSFQSFLYRVDLYEESPLFKFFCQNAKPSDFRDLSRLMEECSDITPGFEVSAESKEKYRWIYESLSKQPRFWREYLDEHILSVLFEEWVFLNEYSWIISRIKKPFNKFIYAGAVCLEFGQRTVETIVRKTLKKKEGELISKVDALRAFGKWIAVGGSPVLSFFNPVVSTFSGLMAGYFLLFDPMALADNSGHKTRLRLPKFVAFDTELCFSARGYMKFSHFSNILNKADKNE